MNFRHQAVLSVVVAAAYLTLCLGAVFAEGSSRTLPEVILAGCEIDYPPFSFVNADGEADGFAVEMMRAAAAAMNRRVTFKTGLWADLKTDLAEGRLMALPLVGRTPEREADFDFTFPYLSMHGAIVVRRGTEDIETLDDLRDRRVAVMRGDNAEEFLRRQGFDREIAATDTFTDALRQLAGGQHDAVLIQRLLALHLIRQENLASLGIVSRPVKVYRQDWCFGVRDGNRELLALLNEGLAIVKADGTFYSLQRKWFSPTTLRTPGSRIVIGGDHDYPPYEYLDKNGEPAGFNVDIMRAIARRMGMDIDIRLGPWAQIQEGLHRGEIDALQGMCYSADRQRQFDFSQPYTAINYVIVTRRDGPDIVDAAGLAGKTIVVQDGDIMHAYAVEHGLGQTLVPAATQRDALSMLAQGHYDCALVAQVAAHVLIERHGWTNLRVIPSPVAAFEYGFAVPHGNPKLLAKFTEGLAVLRETGEYRAIYNQWMTIYDQPGFSLVAVAWYSGLVVGPLAVLLTLSLLWSRSLRRQVAIRTEELRRSQATLQAAMDQSQAGIAIAEAPGGRVVYINGAGLRILGHDDDSSIVEPGGGRSYRDSWTFCTLDGAAMPREETPLFRAASQGETGSLEFVVRRHDGTERSLWAKAGPIVDETGGRIAAIVVFLDVTEQREVESRLRQSEKMEAVGQLAGGIAHDFNNQLSGVMGYAQLLSGTLDDAKQKRYAENIVTAARRAADLTRQLLAFGRKGKYLTAPVDMHRLLGEVVALLEHSIDKRIHIRQVLGATHPVTLGDPSQLQNALLNVALNARDAMPDGGVLTFETRIVELDESFCRKHPYEIAPGPFLQICVTDTGCGIDRKLQDRVFDPFFTTKPEGKGTGMGLASVYGAMRNHRGAVTLYSEPGRGTIVRLYLPLSQRDAATDSATHEPPRGGAARILVIDDEEVIRELAADMLRELGYKVTACKNGREALDYYRQAWREVDLVILDMVMPGMGGRDTFVALRSVNSNVRAILASGYSINGEAQAILDEGVLGFVGKPFNVRDLANAVSDALGNTPSESPQ